MAELFTLAGAVSVTALVVNYASLVTGWCRPWLSWPSPTIAIFLLFWAFFFSVLFVWHQLLKFLTALIRWERVHWFIQGLGIALGGLRGLWWSGFLLIVLGSSGVAYLRASVEERSVLGPRLVNVAHQTLQRVTDEFPGAQQRSDTLVPPLMQPTAK